MFENGQIAVFEGKCCQILSSSESLNSYCASNNNPIRTQKMTKEALRCVSNQLL